MSNFTEILHSFPIEPIIGSLAVTIFQTSTFVQSEPGVHSGFDYSRSNNPTRIAVVDILAKLEKGTNAYAFASGLAAVDAVLKLQEPNPLSSIFDFNYN